MAPKTYLRIALPTPLRRLFDYLPPQGVDSKTLIPGVRIQVPFQSRTLVGILIDLVQETPVPDDKLKSALAVLDETPLLTPDVYQLCQWAADYYHYALGEVLMSALPTFLRQGKAATVKNKKAKTEPERVEDKLPELNAAQAQAVTTICAQQTGFKPFLLDGVTGSGKTEVYLRVIEAVLQAGKQVLVLVPEISLTPQTIARFRARFALPIVALHSNLSESQRLQAWLAARAGKAKIVIGTRSAVFTAFASLGLIIVDEEHDTSFKQQDRFRYHARDLAILRASVLRIPIVLGSATPSLESLLNVKRKRYAYLSLPERAGLAKPPQFEIVNLRETSAQEGLSLPLLQAMREHLQRGHQVMLYLNRRGFAPVYYCTQCAWMAACKRCDANMVYHRGPPRLQCHHCDARWPLPKKCGACGQDSLQPVGLGTQRLEETLAMHFADVPILRVDRDNTRRKGAMQALLSDIQTQKCAILLGTQMLAKGHHFPQVTLVGVIDADAGLFSADFRAAEQMGQLLMQVAGRAGRAEKSGTVILQTHHPDHPLLQTLIHQGYGPFSQTLLSEREAALLPPYSYVAVFRAEAYAEAEANRFLAAIKTWCEKTVQGVSLLGPVPALITKRKGLHCQHLIVKATQRSHLHAFLKNSLQHIEKLAQGQPVKWILDVDPVEI